LPPGKGGSPGMGDALAPALEAGKAGIGTKKEVLPREREWSFFSVQKRGEVLRRKEVGLIVRRGKKPSSG